LSLPKPGVKPFEKDAATYGHYVYTSLSKLSSVLATRRTTEAILAAGGFKGRSVLDMGCGDGYFTIQFWDRGQPRELVGVDASSAAIGIAGANKGARPIELSVGDVHRLPWPPDRFDMALLQSILHHDDDPQDIIREAFRLAPEVLIREPNGNNLGLKIIEKVSPYHREHHEKSYSPRQLRRWVQAAGGEIIYDRFSGFVPVFCPDAIARLMKGFEPWLERLPLLNSLGCAEIVIRARRRERRA
jgi:ubiquinone/menaquinone biosynthesis C-methylase UbiE